MKCKKCGASLLETDQFCASCGSKVIKERRCPECGTVLRDGMKFCHECGRLVGAPAAPETIEIPIADIEKNILLETEHEIGASIRKPVKPVQTSTRAQASAPEQPKKKAKTEMEKPVREKASKEERVSREKVNREKVNKKRVYEEEWEDDEEDYEENDHNIMTIVTVVMAFLIFSVAAFLIFNLVRNQPVKNYGESVENVQEAENTEGTGDGEGTEGEQTISISAEGLEVVGILTIDSNVNVRDNPGTQGTNIIKVAKAGEMYQYCGQVEDGEWYVILLEDGSIGYVFKDYVSVK